MNRGFKRLNLKQDFYFWPYVCINFFDIDSCKEEQEALSAEWEVGSVLDRPGMSRIRLERDD